MEHSKSILFQNVLWSSNCLISVSKSLVIGCWIPFEMPLGKVEALFQYVDKTILVTNPMRNSKWNDQSDSVLKKKMSGAGIWSNYLPPSNTPAGYITTTDQWENSTCATSRFASARPIINSWVLFWPWELNISCASECSCISK